jgi:hypothetical protein
MYNVHGTASAIPRFFVPPEFSAAAVHGPLLVRTYVMFMYYISWHCEHCSALLCATGVQCGRCSWPTACINYVMIMYCIRAPRAQSRASWCLWSAVRPLFMAHCLYTLCDDYVLYAVPSTASAVPRFFVSLGCSVAAVHGPLLVYAYVMIMYHVMAPRALFRASLCLWGAVRPPFVAHCLYTLM